MPEVPILRNRGRGVQLMAHEYTTKAAEISPCGLYRYQLVRAWGDGQRCAFIMLNPSTADGAADDTTIRRCTGFAKRFGFEGYVVVNLFAFRATEPEAMLATADPVGPDNDAHIISSIAVSTRAFAAWGAWDERKIKDRAFAVRCLAAKSYVRFHALKLSAKGQPCHPLFLPAVLDPVPYPHPGADS